MSDDYDNLIRELEDIREELESCDGKPDDLVSRKKELHGMLRSRFTEKETKNKETLISELDEKISLANSAVDSDESKNELYKHFVNIRTIRNDLERRGFEGNIIGRANTVEDRIIDEMYCF